MLKIKNMILGEGMPKICLPLTAAGFGELRKQARKLREVMPDLVEWRADYLNALSPEMVRQGLALLAEDMGEIPILFTIRTIQEGGLASYQREDYGDCCLAAAESGMASLIDVEVLPDRAYKVGLIRQLQEKGTGVIGSSHDFRKTPSREALLTRLKDLEQSGADILKLAVMPQCEEDVSHLMEAVRHFRGLSPKPVIAMPMGELGRPARIYGEEYGSCLTFGKVGEASAPGQMEIGELRRELVNIHKRMETGG